MIENKKNSSPKDLFNAINSGNLELLASILASMPDVNAYNDSGFTPLLEAISLGYIGAENKCKIVMSLIKSKADIDKMDVHKLLSPLSLALRRKDIKTAQYLLDAGALVTVNTTSVVLMALELMNQEILNVLISKKIDLNASDDDGKTPLIMCSSNGSIEAVRYLLEAGADCNIKDKLGLTAHDCSVRNYNQEIADLIDARIEYESLLKASELSINSLPASTHLKSITSLKIRL